MESLIKEFSINNIEKFITNSSDFGGDKKEFMELINELADYDGMMDEIIAKTMLGEELAEEFFKTL